MTHGRARRTTLLLLVNVVVLAALLELAAAAFYFVKYRRVFYTSAVPVHKAGNVMAELASHYQLHPYFGFVQRPGLKSIPGKFEPPRRASANNYGFDSQYNYPFRRTSPDQFIIGVFGGSVAAYFAVYESESGMREFRSIPQLAGKDIVILNFASGAYKQPQQLLVLDYFLAIGQQFDLVVNIDGFNEVALTWVSGNAGLDPSMPNAEEVLPLAKWASRDLSPESVQRLASIYGTRAKLNRVASRLQHRGSAFWHLLNSAYERRLQRQYNDERLRFERSALRPSLTDNLIVNLTPRTTADVRGPAVQLWARSSELMNATLAANSIRYIHVLQPNQYYATQRRFSEEERRIGLSEHSPYRAAIARGYPALREAGASLVAGGEHFIDSVDVFDSVAPMVYADDCCHFTPAGTEVFARYVARAIGENW